MIVSVTLSRDGITALKTVPVTAPVTVPLISNTGAYPNTDKLPAVIIATIS